MGRRRGEHVPSVKRGAYLLAEILPVRYFMDADSGARAKNRAEDAVVRPHEEMSVGADRQRSALASDPGVDDGQVHGPVGKEAVRVPHDEGSGPDVVGSDRVGYVDQRGVFVYREHDSLHGADVVVPEPEIRRQCYNAFHREDLRG